MSNSNIPDSDPIIVAPTNLPVKDDDSLDYDALARNIEKFCNTALSGFVIGSYGGEEFHISEQEKVKAMKTVAEAHSGRKFVIGGIDALSPTEAIRMSELYAKNGADMVRVRIPPSSPQHYHKKPNQESIQAYFEEISRNSPLPIIPIHQPKSPGGIDISPQELSDITSMDNMFAYIHSLNFRYETRLPAFINPKVKFWSCNGALLLPSGMIGAVGACLLFGNWGPHIARDIIDLCINKRFQEAQELQQKINWIDFLGISWGVGVQKTGLNLLGYEGTIPRKPNLPLDLDQIEEIKDALIFAGILNSDGSPAPQI